METFLDSSDCTWYSKAGWSEDQVPTLRKQPFGKITTYQYYEYAAEYKNKTQWGGKLSPNKHHHISDPKPIDSL